MLKCLIVFLLERILKIKVKMFCTRRRTSLITSIKLVATKFFYFANLLSEKCYNLKICTRLIFFFGWWIGWLSDYNIFLTHFQFHKINLNKKLSKDILRLFFVVASLFCCKKFLAFFFKSNDDYHINASLV